MSKSQEKNSVWSDFPAYGYSFITDDFIHNSYFRLRMRGDSGKSLTDIRIIGALRQQGQQKQRFKVGSQVEVLWRLMNDRVLLAKFKSNNDVKVHFDNGLLEWGGYKFNFYGSVNTTRQLNNLSVRSGVHAIGEHIQTDNRLKIYLKTLKSTFYNRTIFNYSIFRFGFLGAYGFHQHLILKNNLLLGCEISQKLNCYLRLQNDKFRRTAPSRQGWRKWFDSGCVDVVSQLNDWSKFGLRIKHSTVQDKGTEVLGVVQIKNKKWEQTYKAQLSSRKRVSLVCRFKTGWWGENATHSIAYNSSGLHPIAFETEFNI